MSESTAFQSKLRSYNLFREFSGEEMEALLGLVDTAEFPAGDCIVRQDTPGECMYLLVQGQAKVMHQRGDRRIELASLREGDFFGELALVDHGPRSADVEALEDCVLLKFTQATLSALAGVYPMAAFKFLIAVGRSMVDRFRVSNRRYIDSLLAPIEGQA